VKPIEVVATRLPEAPHDVAASVEVFSGDDLRARGAASLRDALALAVGVSIAPGGDGGPASAVPEFRGLREFDAFLLVVDDVPWGGALNPAIATASLRDVERIEVLRGPAPVTYGATSFVGVIHVVHRKADAAQRSIEAHGGSFGSGGVALDVPLALGSWSARVSGDFDHAGYPDDNTGFSGSHILGRASKATGSSRIWLSTDVHLLRQEPASPHPREGPALSVKVPLDANHNPVGARLDEDRVALSGGMERILRSGATWSTTASITHSTQDVFRGFLAELTPTTNNASGFREEIEIDDIYADSHLLWITSTPLRFMVGADLLVASGEGRGATFRYTAPLAGSPRASVAEPTTLDLDSEDERLFAGGYGSVEWRPSSRFTASVGVRLNSTAERRGEGTEVHHTRLSGSVGAIVGLWERDADHVRAFADYRDTFKPAAFDFGLAENEGVLEPETSRSSEGGLKVRAINGRFDIEASVFRVDFRNLVTATVVDNLPALVNSGHTRFQGYELATDVRLSRSLWARASYGFHDGRFVDFVQAFDGTPTQLGGKRFEISARRLASAGVTLSPDRGFTASLGLNHTGDRYLNRRNTALAPAFTTYDAGIGYRVSRGELRVDARNLGNSRDPVTESEFGDAQYYRMTARSLRAVVAWRY
jgi:outer membrane receptor protein involved in Fe transport